MQSADRAGEGEGGHYGRREGEVCVYFRAGVEGRVKLRKVEIKTAER